MPRHGDLATMARGGARTRGSGRVRFFRARTLTRQCSGELGGRLDARARPSERRGAHGALRVCEAQTARVRALTRARGLHHEPQARTCQARRQQKMQNLTGAACAAAPRFLKTLARAGSLRAASGRFLKTLGQNFSSWREIVPVAPHFLLPGTNLRHQSWTMKKRSCPRVRALGWCHFTLRWSICRCGLREAKAALRDQAWHRRHVPLTPCRKFRTNSAQKQLAEPGARLVKSGARLGWEQPTYCTLAS